MSKTAIMASMVGVLMGVLTGCGIRQQMPEGKLVSLEYRRSTMRADPQYQVNVETSANGDVVLRAMKEDNGPFFEKKLTAEEVAGFVKIIEEEKMYQYKESYRPLLKVLDGYMWNFSAVFEQGKIYSGGSNARPKDDGLDRIRAYSISLLDADAQPVE